MGFVLDDDVFAFDGCDAKRFVRVKGVDVMNSFDRPGEVVARSPQLLRHGILGGNAATDLLGVVVEGLGELLHPLAVRCGSLTLPRSVLSGQGLDLVGDALVHLLQDFLSLTEGQRGVPQRRWIRWLLLAVKNVLTLQTTSRAHAGDGGHDVFPVPVVVVIPTRP
ncbi:hypothetical protein [Lentzea flava]|uniref:hypothetical protein n=1 Tax=Lentzea flava TaxID=103732 RepID=UPI0020A59FD5|nr:hypothetical protein [Lentzea flava]